MGLDDIERSSSEVLNDYWRDGRRLKLRLPDLVKGMRADLDRRADRQNNVRFEIEAALESAWLACRADGDPDLLHFHHSSSAHRLGSQ
jgi:hypothetical protein